MLPASIGLFQGLGEDEIAVVLAAAVRREFTRSELIIRAEERATQLFLVTGGHVDYFVVTSQGEQILLKRLVPGEIFGVASFLSDPVGYLGTAKPAHYGEVLTWEHRVVRRLAKAYPRLPENALRIALCYIAMYARRHARLVSNTAAERLASAMTSLASRAGHVLPSGVEVEVRNEDLASLADVSLFTASRVLKGWELDGSVEKSRGRVLIRRPEKLLQ
jgi:CRP/FNR family transcriptional regulator, nitrogen oxide reductase regulator